MLQTHPSSHAKHQAQLPEEVPEVLERLLLSEGARDSQAAPEERTDGSSVQRAEPPRSSPCGAGDGGERAAAIMAPKQKEAKKCVWKPVLPQMKGALPSQGLKSRRER